MSGEESREVSAALAGIRKKCRYMCVFLWASLLLFALVWLLAVGAFCVEGGVSVNAMVYMLLCGGATGATIFLLIQMVSEPMRGKSPFTVKQARRLTLMGVLLLFLFAIEAMAPLVVNPAGASSIVRFSPVVPSEEVGVNFDVSLLLFSLILFCLSVVFRYGVLLQRLNDETV